MIRLMFLTGRLVAVAVLRLVRLILSCYGFVAFEESETHCNISGDHKGDCQNPEEVSQSSARDTRRKKAM